MEGGVAIAVWAAVAALLVVAEMLPLSFVALYFAAGALAASLAAAFGGGMAVQDEGATVEVVAIDGVTLVVRPV